MAIIKRSEDDYVFKAGKHAGDTLEDVARNDPGYLQWVFENATEDLDDATFHALEDVMEEHGIEIP